MTSNVVCGYSGADWERNALGQDACVVYAQLEAKCNSGFVINPVGISDAPYKPSNDACTCNTVAYSLQAGCAWCQSAIPDGWWLTLAEWEGNCTSATYNPTGISSSVSTSGIVIPSWAYFTVTTSWDPSISVSVVSGSSNAAIPSATNNGFSYSYSYNPYTYTGPYSGDYPYYNYYGAAVASWAIAVGVMAGLYALLGITVGLVYYFRQKKRKAWYGPMAAFYRNQGVGGYQGNYASGGAPYQPPAYQTPYAENKYPPTPYSGNAAGAPLLYNQEHSAHSPATHTNSLYNPSPSPGFQSTPYQPPQGQYQPPPPEGGPPQGPPPGHQSMYGAPPGAGGGTGYSGRAEVY